MIYNEYFFYGGLPGQAKLPTNFSISDKDIKTVQNMVHKLEESSYYDDVPWVTYNMNDNGIETEEEMSRLMIVMQFITMLAEVNPRHDIKPYHLDMLRDLYLEYDDGKIGMGYKRPFGNSFVMGDVREYIEVYNRKPFDPDKFEDEEEENNDYTEETNAFQEFIEFLPEFFKDFDLKITDFSFNDEDKSKRDNWSDVPDFKGRHGYLRKWGPGVSYTRDKLITQVLDE